MKGNAILFDRFLKSILIAEEFTFRNFFTVFPVSEICCPRIPLKWIDDGQIVHVLSALQILGQQYETICFDC